ncbi:MAG: alpha/beta fold hydrolase [Acidobacteriota bacterium]
MAFLESPSVRLRFEVEGAGPPLVLVPGWTLNLRLWDLVVPRLVEKFRVIRLDPRDAGLSIASPEAEYSRLADAEDAARLLDHLGIAAAHVAGHSRGARTAMVFAMAYPERTLSVACIGSAEPPPEGPAPFRSVASAWVREIRDIARTEGPGAVMDRLQAGRLFGKVRATADGIRLLRDAMEGYRAADLLSPVEPRVYDTARGLERLRAPVLFVAGDEDPFLEECRQAHRRIPGSRLEVLPRCGHMAPIERPDGLAAVLEAFALQSV